MDHPLPRLLPFASFLTALALAGCADSSTDRLGGAQAPDTDSPRLQSTVFIDSDLDGVDVQDALVLQFHRPVVLQGSSIQGFRTDSLGESFGAGAEFRQSLPGSDRVEMLLGDDPVLTPGDAGSSSVTRINVAASGAGIPRVTAAGDFARVARPASRSLELEDVTASAPVLVEARLVDADLSGGLSAGDQIVAAFNKPIAVPPGATVEENFTLPVAGDSFGAAPLLTAASTLSTNRAVLITLGPGAMLRAAKVFAAGTTAAGSPSGLEVAPAPTITDQLPGLPNAASPGVAVDLGDPAATLFGSGREATGVVGTTDAASLAVSARTCDDPGGVATFDGVLAIEGRLLAATLIFVADRGNDRVLIFQPLPPASFTAASWVLGQPDFSSAAADPAAGPATLGAPGDVAFDAATNRLFVADTGHHRVLVWQDLFTVDGETGELTVVNGREASFALGQEDLFDGKANRGLDAPAAGTLAAPSGLAVSDGRLAIADSGNHRVLIFDPLPADGSALPTAVLGQATFTAGEPNRGGTAAADTLSAPGDVAFSDALSINGSSGALLVADSGNHRVLVHETGAPATGAAADLVLGQADFTSSAPATAATRLRSPSSLDLALPVGLLYVADTGNHRVMTFAAGGALASGAPGAPIGQAAATDGIPNRGGAPGAGTLNGPGGVAAVGPALVVSDSQNHRVLLYEGPTLPVGHRDATKVLGQQTFTTSTPGARRFQEPADAILVGGALVVCDTGNHRVLIYRTPPLSGDPDPDVVLGQVDLFSTLPNRGGVPDAATLDGPAALATDGTRLIASDAGNHRVLIWSSRPAANGAPADVILGQPDASSREPNAGALPSARGFDTPAGLTAHDDRLVVADRGNHRVLVFDDLSLLDGFAAASRVLGQPDFEASGPNRDGSPGRDTLLEPRDVLYAAGNLYVADAGNHRVLVWDNFPRRQGEGADGFFGQPDFNTVIAAPAAPETLLEPSALAVDPTGTFLVVADAGHDRVLFFDELQGDVPARRSADGVLGQTSLSVQVDPLVAGAGPATLKSPQGLHFNGYELRVADTGTGRLAIYR
jgi:DNA-binding beta-propeller fold protein YncE